MSISSSRVLGWAAVAVSFTVLYWTVIGKLVQDWAFDDNYSHGFVVLPFALYFAWDRRERLARSADHPSAVGLGVVLVGLLLLLVGRLGAELFLTRVSMLVVLTGGLAFLRGWRSVRILAFPLAFLVLMIPIPAIIFNQVAFPLQLLASRLGETVLTLLGIPVLREGNLIMLARTTLEVAEACSGIRSLVSLFTLGIIYGYFVDDRGSARGLIALATIPIAIAANGLRVAGTGVAAQYMGDDVAHGFLHTFSGWVMFVVAFAMLFIVTNLVLRLMPRTVATSSAHAAA